MRESRGHQGTVLAMKMAVLRHRTDPVMTSIGPIFPRYVAAGVGVDVEGIVGLRTDIQEKVKNKQKKCRFFSLEEIQTEQKYQRYLI